VIKLVFEDSKGKLSPFKSIIEKSSESAIKAISAKIPVDNVSIEFRVDPKGAIKHLGFGGYAWTKNKVIIPVDPDFPGLNKTLQSDLGRTIAHELYHVLQGYTFDKGGNNLLESLIHEGLSDHFEIEISGGKPQKWDLALDQKQLKEFRKKAEKEFDNREYHHQSWFFGEEGIPYWAGYSIGFDIVKKYFQKHSDQKPSTVYKLVAKEFLI